MPQPPSRGAESQIATLVARNVSAFGTLISTLDNDETESSIANSHFARFKLWAANLGAHRPSGGRSLEYRLRDASFIRNHVISLLQELSLAIDEGVSSAEGTSLQVKRNESPGSLEDELADYFQDNEATKSNIDQVLGEIGHVINCLLRLSITVSNPAPHDQFKSRVGVGAIKIFENWYTKHVSEKFAQVDPKTAERLGRAMARRRQYFQYREDHSNRLAGGLDGGELDNDATTVASTLPEHLKESQKSGMKEFADLDDSRSEISRTSYAPSLANAELIRVPLLPKEYVDGPFKCPFCHMIVLIETRRDWKKHVFRDLRPYICLAEDCKTPDQQFLRRRDWSTHMRREHWIIWHCSFGCSEAFQTVKDFREHTRRNHRMEVPLDKMDVLEALSINPDLSKAIGTCSLCLDFQITSAQQYDFHIGEHLEQLALFTLPAHAFEDIDEAGDSNEEEVNQSERSIRDEDSDSIERGEWTGQGDTQDKVSETDTPRKPKRLEPISSQRSELQTLLDGFYEITSGDVRPEGKDSPIQLDENRSDNLPTNRGFIKPRGPPNTSHIPCKFFRQGACQAGNACPFSHDLGATAETVCKYFARGNCKFGPKCANIHILPDGRRITYGKSGVTIGTNDSSRIPYPSIVYGSDPSIMSGDLDYSDSGYSYTNSADLVRHDLDHPQPLLSRRADSADRGSRYPGFNYDPDQNSRGREVRGPPPSTRGFDRIPRAYDYPREVLSTKEFHPQLGESIEPDEGSKIDRYQVRDKIASGLGIAASALGLSPLKKNEERLESNSKENSDADYRGRTDPKSRGGIKLAGEQAQLTGHDKDSANSSDNSVLKQPSQMEAGSQPGTPLLSPTKQDKTPVKGILKEPKLRFPEDPNPIRETVAPVKDDEKLKEAPAGAKWTKISREIVNPEALTIGKERFEVRDDFVIVLRVLSVEEIQAYASATQVLRERRPRRKDGEITPDDDELRGRRHRRYDTNTDYEAEDEAED